MANRLVLATLVVFALSTSGSAAWGQLPLEQIGQVERLSGSLGPHWVWASDAVNERITLVDLTDPKSERMLGVIDGGWGLTNALFASSRPEIYVPETHYSRGSRGERTDVLTLYDAHSMAPVAEVLLPPKRAMSALPTGNAALADGDRFAAVFNMTPATSVSIVDLEKRVFVEEIATPGCSLVYAAGRRRFAMLCGDGSMLLVVLDADGHKQELVRSKPFFDPETDPVTEKAVRFGDRWLFASFEGYLHEVDISGAEPRFREPWSLLDERDRGQSWRIGGPQHLAVHEGSARLYSLVHQGGVDTHKQAGTEIWVYDLEQRQRVQRIEARSPGFTYLGVSLEFGRDWPWPFNGLYGWIVDTLAGGLGVDTLAVTPDAQPLLITGARFSGSLAVYDAQSGDFLSRVITGNMTTLALQAPWDGNLGELAAAGSARP